MEENQRPQFPAMDNNRTMQPPNSHSGNNSNLFMQNNTANGFQRMDPSRGIPPGQQIFQPPPRNMPPNYQQAASRLPPHQGGGQVRFPNMLNPNIGPRPNGLNQNPTNGPPIHQIHPDQPRFPNSVQVMRPPHNGDRPNLPRQPSNQALFARPPYLQQNQNQNLTHKQPSPGNDLYPSNGKPEIPRINGQDEKKVSDFVRKESNPEFNGTHDVTDQRKEDKIAPEEMEVEGSLDSEEEYDQEEVVPPKPQERRLIGSSSKNTNPDMIKDEVLVSGVVLKNIKYFEEKDTAKVPLTPTVLTPVHMGKNAAPIKKNIKENNDGSGVDETPMHHPNLRNILNTPLRLAKIPLYKSKKNKIVGFLSGRTEKGRTSAGKWKSVPEDKLKERRVNWCSSTRITVKPFRKLYERRCEHLSNKKKDTVQKFKPDEELLEFFYDSQTMRNLKGGETKINQNRAQTRNGVANGDILAPRSKSQSRLPTHKAPLSLPTDPPLKSPGTPKSRSVPRTPENPTPPTPTNKKLPMNKIQVGAAPSPNLRAARSKVGSLVNTTHKPGGGNIKIENHKIDFSKTQSRIEAKNDQYVRSGGDKKIPQVKLQWEAKSKIGSLENSTYKPGGGDKKIESIKLDFKEKAKSKVGSKDNVKHVPGGGAVKIESQKLEFKAQSKVGSLDNVKHKPGGGDVKIFDDKTYLKQISTNSSEGGVSGTQSFGDFRVVREVEGRSAPGTPGRKTRIKIKKTTIVSSSGPSSLLEKTTEVSVASKTPVKERKPGKVSQEVKLTFSKVDTADSMAKDAFQSPVEIVRVPANENAPILKPHLSNSEAKENGTRIRYEFYDNDERKLERSDFPGVRQSSDSSDLPEDKLNAWNDSNLSAFAKAEMSAQQKVGQIWAERNNHNNQQQSGQTSNFQRLPNPPQNPLQQEIGIRERQINSISFSQSNVSDRLAQPQQNQQYFPNQQNGMSEQRHFQFQPDPNPQQQHYRMTNLQYQRVPNGTNFQRTPSTDN
ncbi:hypothetical protein RUM43_000577 [Polyplax serrata]|uniref:Microtubule-associated protein n=1 Tax=Polyplax serrata TaxID=468196 RepID=A0AAN8SCQ1_POLSC